MANMQMNHVVLAVLVMNCVLMPMILNSLKTSSPQQNAIVSLENTKAAFIAQTDQKIAPSSIHNSIISTTNANATTITTITTSSSSSTTTTTINDDDSSNSHQHINERPHPFKGATDENGQPGYIHDPTHVRRNQLPQLDFNSICNEAPLGQGEEGPQGLLGLKKIQIAPPPPQSMYKKILCIVYIHSNQHDDVLKSIVQTYGPRCDGFLAASNKTDRSVGAVNILHAGNECYGNMWQKVRSIWSYVALNYIDDYDFFHIGGGDMFVIPENLRHAVSTYNLSSENRPLLLGGAMVAYPRADKRFCGGGSGYTLNRAALRAFIGKVASRSCFPDEISSKEDLTLARCLDPVAKCVHSVDELDETRYHALSPEKHATWTRRRPSLWRHTHLLKHHNIVATSKERLESISSTTVSFHMVDVQTKSNGTVRDHGQRRLHAIVYGYC